MAKSVRKILLSSTAFFLLSCNISPTYQRNDIEKVIKTICKKEFNLTVNAWEAGDTIWIYAPSKNLLDKNGYLKDGAKEDTRRIFLSLQRIILSIDKPPKFYVLVFSDIENIGFDIYYIGFIPDLVKFQLGLISLKEMREREVFLSLINHKALGDKEGKHISRYNITIEEFISYLIKQFMEKTFASKEVEDNFKVRSLQSYYSKGKLSVNFNIMITKYREGIPIPLEEVKKIVKKLLNVYETNIKQIEIYDAFNKKYYLYPR